MKPINGNQSRRIGFTIIELLTVMSIIVILISLLAPALNRVRRYTTDVKQRAQFHAISIGLEAFNAEFDGYPDSNAVDDLGKHYCGAMRLAEAMVGQDLKGFNPTSRFEQRGFIGDITKAGWTDTSPYYVMPYPPKDYPDEATYNASVRSRKMYLELERANAYLLKDIYDTFTAATGISSNGPAAGTFDPCTYVLCDSYNRVTNKTTGRKMGMPILYYKADPSKMKFPVSGTATNTMRGTMTDGAYFYTYNFYDNQALINLGMPWLSSLLVHHLAAGGSTPDGLNLSNVPNVCPTIFYNIIRDKKIPSGDRPYRANSYILISAGFDGEYGTSDDIYNFGD